LPFDDADRRDHAASQPNALRRNASCQVLTWQAQSIRTLPNHVNWVSCRRTNGQRQLISRNRDKALLVRAIPVWKGTAFDVNCDAAIGLGYRICSEVSYRAVGRFFVFVGGTPPLEQASAAPVGISQTSDIRQRTLSLENLMDYGFQIFNLASTFANGNPNFVELLRVQSVGAIIPWRD
jgi:hypothetical protein